MNYYTSDLHIGHTNILKFCKRPWDNAEDMNKDLIKNWNNRVNDDDHIYILGDIAFKADQFIDTMNALKGFKHIILGNHDPKNIQNKKIPKVFFNPLIHEITDEARKIVMCHYPIYEWKGYFKNAVHFHGHTHGTIGASFRPNAFDICVDLHDYEPKTYDEIVGDSLVDVRHQGGKTGGKREETNE